MSEPVSPVPPTPEDFQKSQAAISWLRFHISSHQMRDHVETLRATLDAAESALRLPKPTEPIPAFGMSEVLKIIRYAIEGDLAKVANYAELLASRCDATTAERIRATLRGEGNIVRALGAPSSPTLPGENAEGLSVICRDCGTLVAGVEAGNRVRWVVCQKCRVPVGERETP